MSDDHEPTFRSGSPRSALDDLIADLRRAQRTSDREVTVPATLVLDQGNLRARPGQVRAALARELNGLTMLDPQDQSICRLDWGLDGERRSRRAIGEVLGVAEHTIRYRQERARTLLSNRLFARPMQLAPIEERFGHALIELTIALALEHHKEVLSASSRERAPLDEELSLRDLLAYLKARGQKEFLDYHVTLPKSPTNRHPWADAARKFLAYVAHHLDASTLPDIGHLVSTGQIGAGRIPMGVLRLKHVTLPRKHVWNPATGDFTGLQAPDQAHFEAVLQVSQWLIDCGCPRASEIYLRHASRMLPLDESPRDALRLFDI